MNIDVLTNQICDEIRFSPRKPNVVGTITDVLIQEGFDLRREPSLEEMKQILIKAIRAADERPCVAC